ncbi:MAG: HTTM domain-containing protein [Crocinitomicaceae bacterium]|nr:HTTM domain-containing protein [Crocinitomicaceae bacterium]
MRLLKEFKLSLFKEVNPASLGLFRILVGTVLFVQTFWFIKTDFLSENIYKPVLHFKFYFFHFLNPLPESAMKLMMLGMLASAFLITIGKWFKYACAFFCFSFTYFWLLDKGYFNNHYYFISLLTFLLMFTNADSWGALSKKTRQIKASILYWQVFVLKVQICIVFFIAGINKLNPYWLFEFQPMKHILETKAEIDGYAWLNSEFYFALFSWFGLVFDISICFLLWFKKTRKFAVVFYVVFNLINFWLFHTIGEIGFFPFLLLACVVIFFSPEKIGQKFGWYRGDKGGGDKRNLDDVSLGSERKKKQGIVFFGVVSYIVFQLIFPFRHLLYEDHVDWTGEGQRFSWRMKIMFKDSDIHFYLIEEGSNQRREVNIGHFLTQKQYTNIVYYPDLIPEVAKYIKEEGVRRGMHNPKVVADFKIGFMGSEQQYLVDPETDLSKLEIHPFEHSTWIRPLGQ